MRARWLIVVLALALACPSGFARPESLPHPNYWIFSWVMKDGSYRFILVRDKERYAFLAAFEPSFPGHGNVEQLQAQLLRVPRTALVGWGEATCYGVVYPPKDIMRPVLMYAKEHGINVQVLPSQCE